MDKTRLKKYAELLVKSGGNVQPGQLVVLSCSTDNAYFGRLVVEAAYDAGASEVKVDWTDQKVTRMHALRSADEVFTRFPQWRVDKLAEQDNNGAVYLSVSSPDPDLLAGVDPTRLKNFSKVSGEATKEHRKNMMTDKQRWSIVAIPSPAWAKKVFSDLPEEEAMDKLWGLILKGARADGDDLIGDWEKHKANFVKYISYLNEQKFDALRITTGLGTDFTVGLVKKHIWIGGGAVCQAGLPFFPNLPTEEVFTMPDKNRCSGRVVASMPLSYQGNLIEGFEFTFEDGKVVDFSATKNLETLKNMVEMDEGSRRLGEVALVSNSSPIGQMKTLFYNTLFDENASSHLAMGKAYPTNVEGGGNMSLDELKEMGGNDSLIHVDFMFGTADMRVVGIREDGTEAVIIDKGEYVI